MASAFTTARLQLKDAINESCFAGVSRPYGLNSTKTIYEYRTNIYPQDVLVDVDIRQLAQNVIQYTIEVDSVPTAASSSVTSATVTADITTTHLRHDYVCSMFGDHFDIRMDDIFKVPRADRKHFPAGDNLTPDILIKDSNVLHVVEVGTSHTNPGFMRNVHDVKFNKYFVAIEDRAIAYDICATLSILIVSDTHVITNISNLPQEIVDCLCVRFIIGLKLERAALAKGIILEKDEDMEEKHVIITELTNMLRSSEFRFNAPHQSDMAIDKKYYEEVCGECNYSEVVLAFVDSFNKARKKLDGFEPATHHKYVESVLSDARNPRSDMKAIVNFPAFLCDKHEREMVGETFTCYNKANIALGKIWTSAFHNDHGNVFPECKATLEEEAMEEDFMKKSAFEMERREKRRYYHRVSLSNIMPEINNYLRQDGINAKRFDMTPEMKLRHKAQQSTFKWTTDVRDIDAFIQDDYLFEMGHVDEISFDLISKAHKLANNNSETLVHLKDILRTNGYKLFDLISNIAVELCVSANQHCKSDTFIIKNLPSHNVYLLVKPTKSISHIFYSIFVPKKSDLKLIQTTVFRQFFDMGSGYATDFVSVRLDKIENLASAGSYFIAIMALWMDLYQVRTVNDIKANRDCRAMVLISMLVRLENKSCTEEVITATRYMYMQIFKSDLCMPPDPFSVLSKFPTFFRSRLMLWCVHKIIDSFCIMLHSTPKRMKFEDVSLDDSEGSMPGDRWFGLLNFFTGSEVPTATFIVNIFYVGYARSKNDSPQGNSDWQLLEKILEEEFKLNKETLPGAKGKATVGQDMTGGKQFNLNCVKFGCDLMMKRLKDLHGDNTEELIDMDIKAKLKDHMTHEIASMKASSPFSHDDIHLVGPQDSNRPRPKVIEALAAILDEVKMNPMFAIKSILEEIEEKSGGIVVDLFKKAQKAGVREIYVLHIKSRILQLFIETCSRVICSYFEEETLTHPQNKLTLLDRHKAANFRLSKEKDLSYADYCNSSDKTRWSQNLTMHALAVPLIRILPKHYHPLVIRILNLWTNRYIKMPMSVVKLLHDETPLSSKTFMTLMGKYHCYDESDTPQVFADRKSQFVRLSTGMMQGILHYTSSLLHLSFLHSNKHFSLQILEKFVEREEVKYHFSMTAVCSSDDSAQIISMLLPRSDMMAKDNAFDIRTIEKLVEIVSHAASYHCNYFCMMESAKSLIGCPGYIEFNSEFLFKNTIAKPLIKFVNAAVGLTEAQDYVKRFQTMYNLISDCYASGVSAFATSIIQMAQAILHYKSMGSYSNALFPEMAAEMIKLPSPTYGFYIMDTDLFPGALGFSFSFWLAMQTNENLKLAQSTQWEKDYAPTPEGGLMERLSTTFGDNKRWKLLIQRVIDGKLNSSEKRVPLHELILDPTDEIQWREKIEENFKVLYTAPKTEFESKMKMVVKSMGHGVAESLSVGNNFVNAIRMSVYCINTHCFAASYIEMLKDLDGTLKKTRTRRYVSLLMAIRKRLEEVDRAQYKRKDAETDISFPLHPRYREAKKVIDNIRRVTQEEPLHPVCYRKATIHLRADVYDTPVSLIDIVKHYWFGMRPHGGKTIMMTALASYRRVFSWLTKDASETLENSPFSTHLEMFSFIASQSIKTRTFSRIGPDIGASDLSTMLQSAAMKTYKSGAQLSVSKKFQFIPTDYDLHGLHLKMMIPVHKVRSKLVLAHLDNINDRVSMQSLQTFDRRMCRLAVIAQFASKKSRIQRGSWRTTSRQELSDQERIKRERLELITNYTDVVNHGMHVIFTEEQKRGKEGKGWEGKGEALVKVEGVVLKLSLDDGYVRRIETNNIRSLQSDPGILTEVFRNLQVRHIRSYEEGNFTLRYDGRDILFGKKAGCPIMENLHLALEVDDFQDLRLKIGQSSIQIVTQIANKEIILIEYSTRDTMRNVIHTGGSLKGDKDNVWSYWVEHKPIDPINATGLIDKTIGEMKKEKGTDGAKYGHTELSRWVKKSLKSRLNIKRLLSLPSFIQPTFEPNLQSELTDQDLEDLVSQINIEFVKRSIKSGFADVFKEANDDHEPINVGDHSDEDMANDQSLFENVLRKERKDILAYKLVYSNSEIPAIETDNSSELKRTTTIYNYHPFWDDFIDNLEKSDRDFFKNLSRGKYKQGSQLTAKALMMILEINDEGFAGSPDELYKLAKTKKVIYEEPPSTTVVGDDEMVVQNSDDEGAGPSGVPEYNPNIRWDELSDLEGSSEELSSD